MNIGSKFRHGSAVYLYTQFYATKSCPNPCIYMYVQLYTDASQIFTMSIVQAKLLIRSTLLLFYDAVAEWAQGLFHCDVILYLPIMSGKWTRVLKVGFT